MQVVNGNEADASIPPVSRGDAPQRFDGKVKGILDI
jgi:hypothetical protein